ncbi:MAG: hypothetical protein ABI333_07395 [bacterium]
MSTHQEPDSDLAEPPRTPEQLEAEVAELLAEVEFYLEQGLEEEAGETLADIVEAYGADALALASYQKVKAVFEAKFGAGNTSEEEGPKASQDEGPEATKGEEPKATKDDVSKVLDGSGAEQTKDEEAEHEKLPLGGGLKSFSAPVVTASRSKPKPKPKSKPSSGTAKALDPDSPLGQRMAALMNKTGSGRHGAGALATRKRPETGPLISPRKAAEPALSAGAPTTVPAPLPLPPPPGDEGQAVPAALELSLPSTPGGSKEAGRPPVPEVAPRPLPAPAMVEEAEVGFDIDLGDVPAGGEPVSAVPVPASLGINGPEKPEVASLSPTLGLEDPGASRRDKPTLPIKWIAAGVGGLVVVVVIIVLASLGGSSKGDGDGKKGQTAAAMEPDASSAAPESRIDATAPEKVADATAATGAADAEVSADAALGKRGRLTLTIKPAAAKPVITFAGKTYRGHTFVSLPLELRVKPRTVTVAAEGYRTVTLEVVIDKDVTRKIELVPEATMRAEPMRAEPMRAEPMRAAQMGPRRRRPRRRRPRTMLIGLE